MAFTIALDSFEWSSYWQTYRAKITYTGLAKGENSADWYFAVAWVRTGGGDWNPNSTITKYAGQYYLIGLASVFLQSDTTYEHQMGVDEDIGDSRQYSNIIEFTTPAAPAPEPPGKATNPTPANEAIKVGEAQMFVDTVDLAWDAPSEMGSGAEYMQYKIYFRKYGDGWSLLGTVNHSVNNGWSVGSLEVFTLYQWRIDSYDTDADVTTTGDTWWFVTAHESFYVSFFNDPERRDDYDPDKIWDEDNEAWYDQDEIGIQLAIAGGGRYKQQIVVIGTNNSGVGKIYFGDV